MTDIDKALVDLVVRQIPLEKKQHKQLKDASPLGIAILGLTADPDLLDAWYRDLTAKKEVDTLEAFVSLMVLRDEVADTIDARLERGEFAVLNDLVKLGVPWDSDTLKEALEHDEYRFAAAMCLMETENKKAIRAYLESHEDVRDVVRAIGLLGADEYARDLEALKSDEDNAPLVDAALLGIMEPSKYGKKLLAGEVETAWLSDSVLVADAFQVTGASSWVDTLGILDAAGDQDAFEFAALLGMVAATATWQAGGDPDASIQEPESEHEFMTAPRFSVAAGLVPDEELQSLAFEVALHEIRTVNEEGSPGIAGLPLTQTDPDLETLTHVKELLEAFDPANDDCVERVEVVRTLCDAAVWAVVEPDFMTTLEPTFKKLLNQGYPLAVRGAAQLVLSVLGYESAIELNEALDALTGDIDTDALAALATGEDIKALCAMRHLTLTAEEEGVEMLAHAWALGTVSRGDAFRVALEEAIHLYDEAQNDA